MRLRRRRRRARPRRCSSTTGPGCVTHLYCALAFPELTDYRDAILRCWWDGEATPSVEVPLGDFFGVAHARIRALRSALVAVNPGFGSSHGLHAYFPMPFATGARITLEHRGERPLGGALPAFWFHVDYETYDAPLPDDALRFHAQWRQERPTTAIGPRPNVQLHGGANLDGAENYVALDAAGAGQMVGPASSRSTTSPAAGTARATTWCSSTATRGRRRIHGTGHRGDLRRRRVSDARVRRARTTAST